MKSTVQFFCPNCFHEVGSPHGRYPVCGVEERNTMERHIKEGVLDFVNARRKITGGFGATPLLPATAEDTYHALCILKTISGSHSGLLREDEALRNYLEFLKRETWASARSMFQVSYSCSLADIAMDEDRLISFVKNRVISPDLNVRYYCARIIKETLKLKKTFVTEFDLELLHWRVATEIWMNLYTAKEQGLSRIPHRRSLVAWLQACQTGDGGFGFLPGTTSYIENCHTCLRALALLGAKPLDAEGCRQYVLACRTASGGFARTHGATAFLDATWHAVASIVFLSL